ncbi:hypothetical protein SDC9_122168 [bioreactor metagenome]|uniref:Uncharacterized protein n=1 Tax=bioreactor metagenome TaxID=1076179 RepID=A0A645CE00_9ZZZZ
MLRRDLLFKRGNVRGRKLHGGNGVSLLCKIEAVFPRARADIEDARVGKEDGFNHAAGGDELHFCRLAAIQARILVEDFVGCGGALRFVFHLLERLKIHLSASCLHKSESVPPAFVDLVLLFLMRMTHHLKFSLISFLKKGITESPSYSENTVSVLQGLQRCRPRGGCFRETRSAYAGVPPPCC